MVQVVEQGGISAGDSRAELISSNGAVATAFALTRATMAAVILGSLFLGGFEIGDSAQAAVQFSAALAALVGIAVSALSVLRRSQPRALSTTGAWSLILLDSILAVGVMAVIDAETSPLAWVALVTPVLETAVLFSMTTAGFVWLGLSLGFLALRLVTNVSDDATTDTLVLSIQQVLAVLFISGPAALLADSAEQRISQLADARRNADHTSQRLRRVAESARRMSQDQTIDGILGIASRSAVSLGFDQADVVVRDSDGDLAVHSIEANGPASNIAPEVLSSIVQEALLSASQTDSEHGDAVRLAGFASGHALALSTNTDDGEPEVVLRVWKKHEPATAEDVRSLSLLGGHAREAYRASKLLSQAQAHADQLHHEVRHDGLTGLANRAYVLETLEERIERSQPIALLFIDLDGFKAVNDSLGHRAGDQALVEVAKRLLATNRDGEFAGRMGGDEFVLLTPLTAFDNLVTLERYGDEIVESLSEPIQIEDEQVQLGASVGVCVHDGTASPDQFISSADDAMYGAKRSGGGTEVSQVAVAIFDQRDAS